mmetsp:Transcript_19212/g.48906  ORF Transcript_19212/g.48906 Transcript_19212/m.48906 type:complete len:458 (-) Transcript_19212:212-1585(-)
MSDPIGDTGGRATEKRERAAAAERGAEPGTSAGSEAARSNRAPSPSLLLVGGVPPSRCPPCEKRSVRAAERERESRCCEMSTRFRFCELGERRRRDMPSRGRRRTERERSASSGETFSAPPGDMQRPPGDMPKVPRPSSVSKEWSSRSSAVSSKRPLSSSTPPIASCRWCTGSSPSSPCECCARCRSVPPLRKRPAIFGSECGSTAGLAGLAGGGSEARGESTSSSEEASPLLLPPCRPPAFPCALAPAPPSPACALELGTGGDAFLSLSRVRPSLEVSCAAAMWSGWQLSLRGHISFIFCSLRRIEEFQWFLIELSVRPGSALAISAHLLPTLACSASSFSSSSGVHASFRMPSSSWLCQRSRHCLPMRPGRCEAICDHFLGPSSSTRRITVSSSSFVHGPLTSAGLSTLDQRCAHCTSVLSRKCEFTFFQSASTSGSAAAIKSLSSVSSSGVHAR